MIFGTRIRRALGLAAFSWMGMGAMPIKGIPTPVEGAEGGNHKLTLMMANSYLDQKQTRRAMQAYNMVLAARPNHLRARAGQVRALSDLLLCDGIEESYTPLQGTSQDTAEVQVAMGVCAEAGGRLDEAVAFYRRAEGARPTDPAASVALARLQLRMGDALGFEATLAELPGRERGPAYGALLEAERAEFLADPLGVGMAQGLGPFTFLPQVRKERERLFVTLEVAESEPDNCGLYASLFRFGSSNIGVACQRAECERRAGRPDEALEVLERPALALKSWNIEARAVRARVLVDLNDFVGAEAVLRGLDDRHREVLASRWYLAHRQRAPNATALRAALVAHPFATDPAALILEP